MHQFKDTDPPQIILTPLIVGGGIIGTDVEIHKLEPQDVFTIFLRCALGIVDNQARTHSCQDGMSCLHKQDSIQWSAALTKLIEEHNEHVKKING